MSYLERRKEAAKRFHNADVPKETKDYFVDHVKACNDAIKDLLGIIEY